MTDGSDDFDGLDEDDLQVIKSIQDPRKRQAYILSLTQTNNYMQEDPFAKNMTPEHLDKMLDNDGKLIDNQHEDGIYERRYTFAYVLVGLISLGLGVVYLADKNPNLLINLVTAVISGAGGYGIGIARASKKR